MAGWERRSTAELRPGGLKANPGRSRLTKAERIRRAEAMGPYTVVPKTKRVVAKRLVARGDRSLEAAVARANRSADVGAVHQALLDAARRRAR